MTPDLWVDLRNLGIAVACILGSAAVFGALAADWLNGRDEDAGRGQPQPVWTAEERWGR